MPNTTIVFNGKTIELEALLKNAKSFPRISVQKKELNTYHDDVSYAEVNGPSGAPDELVCFFKHDNRWVILSGHDKVKNFLDDEAAKSDAVIKGCLVSKQMFKHLTIVTVPLTLQNNQAAKVERDMEEQQRAEQERNFQQGQYQQRPPYRNDRFGRDQGNGFNRRP